MKCNSSFSGDHQMDVVLSFDQLINAYAARIESEKNSFKKLYYSALLQAITKDDFPNADITEENLNEYSEPIDLILSELFPKSLSGNEIKAATIPFSSVLFNCTDRLTKIFENAGENYTFNFLEEETFDRFRLACGLVLNKCYNMKLDIGKLLHAEIPDANGNLRTYRITYNADFIDVFSNSKSEQLEEHEINDLLRFPDDEDRWRKAFPHGSYQFKGFGIISFTDVTVDASISELKTILLNQPGSKLADKDNFVNIFKKMFNMDNIYAGFTSFDAYDSSFEQMHFSDAPSYLLGQSHSKLTQNAICKDAYNHLIKLHKPLIIPDVENYHDKQDVKFMTKNLLESGIKSAVLYPVTKNERLIGVLELGSDIAFGLNSFNTIKIENIIDYIKAAVIRGEEEDENRVKAIIQTECTSIHPSVQWKFEREARRILKSRINGKEETFKDLGFEDVYPLYGQIDIVGSSDSRNRAIKKDLCFQLDNVCEIIASAKAYEPLPIYDQIGFRVQEYKDQLQHQAIDANSERGIIKLLTDEINPVMHHIKNISHDLKERVATYQEKLDPLSGVIYESRNNYDNTVQTINHALSRYIDNKQVEAQGIYEHYFERFKTDGVEHNIYIGGSITEEAEFNVVYLYNLRLWQLQTMIEMEDKFYSIQENLPSQLDAASMILVFDNTLSIRYRIDEKRFDVDGTYNARYEVIKKRIDKAHIKGTEERITQKGTISIIYTNKENESEYMRYVSYLQHKKYLGDEVESLELEDVQGVIGLKAIRVNILYGFKASENRMTYDDLIEQLSLKEVESE
ncbi:hypothetical protein SAMN05192588_0760 [Nonlabens sp. Hel1_33_55]|uniref:GAF domain-containing protein n=1 Tax=Nonlabens sp. Hel1_33_55 TaxID=1336802 RepID=UPI000875AF6B|nr:GAF domain-containing protein [Nonlabens sp. Hel1_33_55]SCY01947.1 hypothetical protein SAMN05192588_0760 [Nonlabens sp. Hel1_33_55]